MRPIRVLPMLALAGAVAAAFVVTGPDAELRPDPVAIESITVKES